MNEEFEKWAESEGFDLERDFEAPENYVCEKTGAALIGWQASRKHAVEECAAKLDAMNDSGGDSASYDKRDMYAEEIERMRTLTQAAEAIRSLQKE